VDRLAARTERSSSDNPHGSFGTKGAIRYWAPTNHLHQDVVAVTFCSADCSISAAPAAHRATSRRWRRWQRFTGRRDVEIVVDVYLTSLTIGIVELRRNVELRITFPVHHVGVAPGNGLEALPPPDASNPVPETHGASSDGVVE
jgi:hypothetical protein